VVERHGRYGEPAVRERIGPERQEVVGAGF